MKQTRAGSLIETITNTAIGYVIAVIAQLGIYPLFGIAPSFAENCAMAACFTAVSLIRSYTVRRVFNHFEWFVK